MGTSRNAKTCPSGPLNRPRSLAVSASPVHSGPLAALAAILVARAVWSLTHTIISGCCLQSTLPLGALPGDAGRVRSPRSPPPMGVILVEKQKFYKSTYMSVFGRLTVRYPHVFRDPGHSGDVHSSLPDAGRAVTRTAAVLNLHESVELTNLSCRHWHFINWKVREDVSASFGTNFSCLRPPVRLPGYIASFPENRLSRATKSCLGPRFVEVQIPGFGGADSCGSGGPGVAVC